MGVRRLAAMAPGEVWLEIPGLTLIPSRWSACRPGTGQTRSIGLCGPRGCHNVSQDHPHSGLFRLVRECQTPDADPQHSIAALVFVSLVLGAIVLGFTWRCGCFSRARRGVNPAV